MNLRYDVYSVLILLLISIHIKVDAQDISKSLHLSDIKFKSDKYYEYPDNEERGKRATMQLNLAPHLKDTLDLRANNYFGEEEPIITDTLDKNIIWDRQWATQLNFTQMSAVSMDPNGNIAIFHRGDRIWGPNTFDNTNRFNPDNGPIAQNTIVLLDKSGKMILEWGKNMFYLPHGLTIDQSGSYWITDVAMHQVFKFDAQDIEKHTDELKRARFSTDKSVHKLQTGASFENSILKPSLILGEAFEPGNDEKRFCKPTAVAVHNNGDFFVSDGYCNSRIVKFNKKGERILHWGRHWGVGEAVYSQLPPPNAFLVPHALALASALNYIYVADRENGRVLCFFASNGTFHREYKHPAIGTKVYSIAYAREKLYLVNGPDPYTIDPVPVRGFVLDIYSGTISSIFGPKENMNNPHDLYVTQDGSEIYVVELNNHKIYRFLHGENDSMHSDNLLSTNRHRPRILVHPDTKDSNMEKSSVTRLILGIGSAAISFIIICIVIAAIVARCQKRGRAYGYNDSTVELSKLV